MERAATALDDTILLLERGIGEGKAGGKYRKMQSYKTAHKLFS
jgi:hypothetical protein